MVFLLQGYSQTESILKLIGLIVLCFIVIIASYYTTKFVGKKQNFNSPNTNFKAIDTLRLSQNKYLQIIKIGEKYFCIAVCKDNVNLICELNEEEIKLNRPESKLSFKDILLKKTKKTDESDILINVSEVETEEEKKKETTE